MASTFDQIFGFSNLLPSTAVIEQQVSLKDIYEANRHRLYALSFWMTDNELTAQELMQRTFKRAFNRNRQPTPEALDRAFLAELRKLMAIGELTLRCGAVTQVSGVRRNTMRVHLERAIVQLPSTERLVFVMHDIESYDHERIARILGITADQSQHSLHQARLRIRELLAGMISA